ncbi:MAG: PEP-CTERM sorting domain-containing protein [Pirellulales bacterium]|nr:PEP-CTERM sorting domain-containing protein [Pirellulales bacterium]
MPKAGGLRVVGNLKRMCRGVVTATAVSVLCAARALAVPIVYDGTLTPGVPFSGVNTQPPFSFDQPVGANYISFFANAGDVVNVFGDRQAGHYDMSFWVFQGLFTDTSAFGAFFDVGDPGFIAIGDDQDLPNIEGPYGDPNVSFVAPVTGSYTVAATNFASSNDPPNPFTLTFTVSSVPEPASLALWLAAVGAAGYVRCRTRRLRHEPHAGT